MNEYFTRDYEKATRELADLLREAGATSDLNHLDFRIHISGPLTGDFLRSADLNRCRRFD